MTTRSEQLTALIEEMDQIEQLAASFRIGSPEDDSKATQSDITKFREWYLDWYAQCRALLNEAGANAFEKYYSQGSHNIHKYMREPAGTFYGRSRKHENRGSTFSFYQWNVDYGDNFSEPFNEQRLLLMRVCAAAKTAEASPLPPAPSPAIDTIRLHPRVRAVSSKLFNDGHYRLAIFRACLALNEAVQQRSGRSDLDGTSLMQHVFSKDKPVLKFNRHPDEQQGYMWMFSGMSMAVRNPRAHQVGVSEDLDANEALELLASLSALFRALDTAEKV